MEARLFRAVALTATFASLGASYRTTNFITTAPTAEFARVVGESAERDRRDLAIEWLGRELPRWPQPCPISVTVGPHLGAGGATSFAFHNGQPFGWTMSIQGSRERILDSVLPHEITHTIFATHFGRPLPRWADEGACTTVEHVSERTKQHHLLLRFLTSGHGIAFNRMFAMKEYPPNILALYSQGYSLARYLIAQRGHRTFVEYVGDGMRLDDWGMATRKHYGFQDLSDLQVSWLEWVKRGSSTQEARVALASRMESRNPQTVTPSQPVIRAQNESKSGLLPFSWARGRGAKGGATGIQPISLTTHSDNPTPTATGQVPRPRPTSGSWYAAQRRGAASGDNRSGTEVVPIRSSSGMASPPLLR